MISKNTVVVILLAVMLYVFPRGINAAEASVTPDAALQKLTKGNAAYVKAKKNNADISQKLRKNTADNGQTPYAVVVTCSDSRVPPEHIFNAGIGDLFVIRTAGNVIGDFELGSIEYGAEHLHASLIVIMGHSKCGAIAASIGDGHAEGFIAKLVEEIKPGIAEITDATQAENVNVANSANKLHQSEILTKMIEHNEVKIVKAKYDIGTGKVEFFD
jgi:carbonic anhydrase